MFRKFFVSLILTITACITLHAQSSSSNGPVRIIIRSAPPSVFAAPKGGTLYFLDSVRVTYDQDKTPLQVSDIADMHILTDKDSIRILKLGRYDTVVYLFTKAYMQRPALQKSIPSTKQLYKWNGKYYYMSKPYTGKVIDYFVNGGIRYRGTFERGEKTGTHYYYNINGSFEKETYSYRGFKMEVARYSQADKLLKKQLFKKDQEILSETYYQNGQVRSSMTRLNDRRVTVSYFSNGKLSDSIVFTNKFKMIRSPRIAAIKKLTEEKNFSQALKLDPENAYIYSFRAYVEADSMEYDAAISDMDTCLLLEPYDPDFFGQRAFTRIKKHAYTSEKKVLDDLAVSEYLSNHPEIPAAEMKKIRHDLQLASTLPGAIYPFYAYAYKYLPTSTP